MSDQTTKPPVSPGKRNDEDYFAAVDYLTQAPAEEKNTGKKLSNWFHYHKLLLGVLLLAMIIGAYFILKPKTQEADPDYRIAVISTIAIPEDTADALTEALSAFGTDQNGDGKVTIALSRYVVDLSDNEDADLSSMATGKIQLSADLQDDACSSIFLTVDPQALEASTGLLLSLDGSTPDEDAATAAEDWEDLCYAWTDCPALSSLDLGDYKGYTVLDLETGSSQDVMADFYVCRRILETEAQQANNPGVDAFWEAMTAH